MAGKEILEETINSVLMGTSDVNQHRIEEVLDEIICKVVEEKQRGASQLLKTDPEHRSQGKKNDVLTSSHEGQVLFNFCNLIKYLIHFKIVRYMIIKISNVFRIHEICNGAHMFNCVGAFISHGIFKHEIPKLYETNVKGEIWWQTNEGWRWRDMWYLPKWRPHHGRSSPCGSSLQDGQADSRRWKLFSKGSQAAVRPACGWYQFHTVPRGPEKEGDKIHAAV